MRKLLATQSGFVGAKRLYLDEDHVLLSQVMLVNERLKRFYFRDIQAIVCHQTNTGLIISLALALSALIFTASAIQLTPAFQGEDYFRQFVASLMYVFAPIGWVAFLYNLIKGKTCETWLYTPVSRVRLMALSRWPKTNKVLEQLIPRIQHAQQEIADEDAGEEAEHAKLAPWHKTDQLFQPGYYGDVGSAKPFAVFYVLVLVFGVSLGVNLFHQSIPKSIVDELIFVMMLGAVSYVFYHYRGKIHLPSLRIYTIVVLFVLMLVRNITSFWFQVGGSFDFSVQQDLETMPLYVDYGPFYMVLVLLLGGIGLGLCLGHVNWAANLQANAQQATSQEAPDGGSVT